MTRNILAINKNLSLEKTKFQKCNFLGPSVPPIRLALPLIKSIDGDAALHALLF